MYDAFISLCGNGNLHRIPLYSACVERVMWTRSCICSQHEQGTQMDFQSRPTLCCGNTSMLLLLLLVWLQEPKWLHFYFNRTQLWNRDMKHNHKQTNRPTDNQRTPNRQPTVKQTTNRQPPDNQQTTNRRPTDTKQTTNNKQAGNPTNHKPNKPQNHRS